MLVLLDKQKLLASIQNVINTGEAELIKEDDTGEKFIEQLLWQGNLNALKSLKSHIIKGKYDKED